MIFLFILTFSREDGVVAAVINEYADLLFEKIDRYAHKYNLDPTSLPNITKDVSKISVSF